MLVTGTYADGAHVWDVQPGHQFQLLGSSHKGTVSYAEFSPDSTLLAIALKRYDRRNFAQIYDIVTQTLVSLEHPYPIQTVHFNEASNEVVVACENGITFLIRLMRNTAQ